MKLSYNQFASIYPKYKITKPIRIIEMFGGYGTFSLGLKYIGANYESYKLVEWAIKSIQAYKNVHFSDDHFDYSSNLSIEELKDFLFNKGHAGCAIPVFSKRALSSTIQLKDRLCLKLSNKFRSDSTLRIVGLFFLFM